MRNEHPTHLIDNLLRPEGSMLLRMVTSSLHHQIMRGSCRGGWMHGSVEFFHDAAVRRDANVKFIYFAAAPAWLC